MKTNWLASIDWLLSLELEYPSQRKYLLSVRKLVVLDDFLYPTVAQRRIVGNLVKHYERVTADEVVKQVMTMYPSGI